MIAPIRAIEIGIEIIMSLNFLFLSISSAIGMPSTTSPSVVASAWSVASGASTASQSVSRIGTATASSTLWVCLFIYLGMRKVHMVSMINIEYVEKTHIKKSSQDVSVKRKNISQWQICLQATPLHFL